MNLIKTNNKNFPSIIDEFFKPKWFEGNEDFSINVPAVNIKETDNEFSVELAAPGKKKEDFSIEVDDNVLCISSEAKTETEEKEKNGKYTRKEFSYSSFKRAFTLPESVNESKIKANYNDGVLNVILPKKESSLPKSKRMIDIS